MTNFIGMGVNTHILKNVVYKTRVVKTPKKLVSCHKKASVPEVRMHMHIDARTRQMNRSKRVMCHLETHTYVKENRYSHISCV